MYHGVIRLKAMGIKDELDFLKKSKGARVRPRSASVEQAWSRLSGDDGLSVKEKLEKLIALTGAKTTVKPPAPAVEIDRGRGEPLLFLEHPYPLRTKYGRHRLEEALAVKGEVLFRLSHDVDFEELDLSTALFLDLETTGLSGGTGTVPFLVGMGYFRDGRFNIGQFFLGELGEAVLFHKGKDGDRYRSEARVKVEYGAPIVVRALIGDLLIFVCVAEDHEKLSRQAGAGLDDEWYVAFVSVFLIDVLQVLAREFLMAC